MFIRFPYLEVRLPVLVHGVEDVVERPDHAAGVVLRAHHRVGLAAAGGAVREHAAIVTFSSNCNQYNYL